MPIKALVNENNEDNVTVVLRGHGLAGARVGEEAEIIIDGKDAGDGEPKVTLTGLKSNIKVKLIPIGPRLYKALYESKQPGNFKRLVMNFNELIIDGNIISCYKRDVFAECSLEPKTSQGMSFESSNIAKL